MNQTKWHHDISLLAGSRQIALVVICLIPDATQLVIRAWEPRLPTAETGVFKAVLGPCVNLCGWLVDYLGGLAGRFQGFEGCR